jgi:hypothetical protein
MQQELKVRLYLNYKNITLMITAFSVFIMLLIMVKSLLLKIIFSILYTLAVILELHILYNYTKMEKYKMSFRRENYSLINLIAFCFGLLSSFIIIYFPARSELFISLNFIEILRCISAFYLLSFFPGWVLLNIFSIKKNISIIERITLTLALSYVINVIFGLLMYKMFNLSNKTYLFMLWIFVFLCFILQHIFKDLKENSSSLKDKEKSKNNYIVINPIYLASLNLICLMFLLSAYLIVLTAEPTGYSVSGDVARYFSTVHDFLNYRIDENQDFRFAEKYYWFQIFIGVASILTGLHPFYVFVTMQFLIILFPLSLYILLSSVFKNKKISILGTMLICSAEGLSSIGILKLWAKYFNEDIFSALVTLRLKTQNWPWLSVHFFIAATMDWSLLFLCLNYLYHFVKNIDGYSFFIGTLLLVASFFTHNIVSYLIAFSLLFFYVLRDFKYLLRAIVIFTTVIIISLLFDILSFHIFIKTLLLFKQNLNVILSERKSMIILILFISLFISFMKYINAIKAKKVMLFLESKRILFALLSFVIIAMLTISSIVIIFNSFDYIDIRNEIIFPWYIYLLRFTPFLQLLPLFIYVMPKILCSKRYDVWFMISWIFSSFLLVVILSKYPLSEAQVIGNRICMALQIPIGALSVLGLCIFLESIYIIGKKKQIAMKLYILFRYLLIYCLFIIFGFAFLSRIYSIEIFYYANTWPVPFEKKDFYEFLIKLPPNSTILTYSYARYLEITSLVPLKVYAYYQYYLEGEQYVSEIVRPIFEANSTKDVLNTLSRLGITHIIINKYYCQSELLNKFQNHPLLYALKYFPKVFENSFYVVYEVKLNNVKSNN